MALEPQQFFKTNFESLTGSTPYPWQRKLFIKITAGHWPEIVDLPTGAGKTAVLHIWLLALAWSILAKTGGVPRRLAWVVNRRVVVDQVTTEAESLVREENPRLDHCPEVRDALASVSISGKALAVSTLRGQRADRGAWSQDPSTPSVVVGTVDMIGSRLLFRGYRSSKYRRPIHAGLLGVDTLIVNDESHLSPAFARLLEQISQMEPAKRLSGKCFRFLLLSATPSESGLRRFDHGPEEDALESKAFERIYEAPKILTLHEVEAKAIESTVWKLATEQPVQRTVVFIEQPEKASSLASKLEKDGRRIKLLTGTMRGFERDQLASDPVFSEFLRADGTGEPAWLVSTSAGEVGINLTCERLISGLVEADHLLQRFGRLNRFGGRSGEAHVVHPPLKSDKKQERLLRTLEYLRKLNKDISCRSLWESRPPDDAREAPPAMARLEKRLIDVWAQTTFGDRFVPAVTSWLHGKQDSGAPETELAWRSDVEILAAWRISSEQIERILERYPVLTQERLREPTHRVHKKLCEIASRLAEPATTWLIQIEADGTARRLNLAQIVDDSALIAGKLLLLPDGLGTLERGMFRTESSEIESSLDVADRNTDRNRCRYHIEDQVWTRIGMQEGPFTLQVNRESLAQFALERAVKPPLLIRHPEEENKTLAYFGQTSTSKGNLRDIPLPKHLESVEAKAAALAASVDLDAFLNTFKRAGILHDTGKLHEVWQRAMGGSMAAPIAKSKAPLNLRLVNGYRHEVGSLVKATDEKDDLCLHLIASHHAGARPFFEIRQFDRSALRRSKEVAMESVRRYARLQDELGPWGLAYLEAVFKCADAIVSAEEGEAESE